MFRRRGDSDPVREEWVTGTAGGGLVTDGDVWVGRDVCARGEGDLFTNVCVWFIEIIHCFPTFSLAMWCDDCGSLARCWSGWSGAGRRWAGGSGGSDVSCGKGHVGFWVGFAFEAGGLAVVLCGEGTDDLKVSTHSIVLLGKVFKPRFISNVRTRQ
jgi:hypothetical protein